MAVAALSFLSGEARAQGWIATVGARVGAAPPYEGADNLVLRPSPTVSLRRADRPYRFTPPDGGATLALIDTRHFVAGPLLRFRYKRSAAGDLTGLRPIRWAAEPGAFVDVWPTSWLRGRAELRHGVGGHHGLVADVGADLIAHGAEWEASVGPRVGWGDKAYLTRYFGVTPEEAARSPLIATAYQPSAGRRYTGVEVAGAYHLDDRWMIKADIGYRRLAGKAAHSPIVQTAGRTEQILGSVGLSYSFGLGR